MKPKRDNSWASAARYIGLTTLLPASAFAGYIIGYWLDRLFSTQFLKFVFLILGIASGLIQIVRELNRNAE